MTMKMSLLVLLLAVYLLRQGTIQAATTIHYDNALSPDVPAYSKLISSLRAELDSGYHSHGIPVLRQSTVEASHRFILVELESGSKDIITVAIDVVNVRVVGYLAPWPYSGPSRNVFYYFTNTPCEALQTLFPGALFSSLGYSNNFKDLGDKAKVWLGHPALNSAILALSHNDFNTSSQRDSLIVIIQMVSQAARIRYFENLVRRYMRRKSNFLPNHLALSLEDNWSALSEQIQQSGSSRVFPRTIEVHDLSNRVVPINNVQAVFRGAALALLAYHCHDVDTSRSSNNIIKMPVDVGDVYQGKQCPIFEPTTNIVGPEELCADVRDGFDTDGTPVQLYPCGSNTQRNQRWTFQSDGTIRSLGKCLTTKDYTDGNYAMIYNCSRVVADGTKWALTDIGTLINPQSKLVLAAKRSKSGANLIVSIDNNSTIEAWTTGFYTPPVVTYITGFGEKCLQANDDNTSVLMAECVISRPKQQWALYTDSTIRLYGDRNLCLTSNGQNIGNTVILFQCEVEGYQRWNFRADGTILNPKSGLVMDVMGSDASQGKIILYPPTGNPNQQWLAFF